MVTWSIRVLPFVVLSLVAPVCAPAAEDAEAHKIDVEIINERSLPPARLADALYAKALLEFDVTLFRKAANLHPDDPVYWYRLATSLYNEDGQPYLGQMLEEAARPPENPTPAEQLLRKELQKRRRVLERALAADPDYVPALYAYALTKPGLEQRMRALEHVAVVDRDNAKAYYIMALLQAEEVTQGKKWLVKEQAAVVSNAEWERVLNLVRKGNQRTSFNATSGRLSSIDDIRVRSNGKLCPTPAVENALRYTLNDLGMGGLAESPNSYVFAARARQLARQTSWQARHSAKTGMRAEATRMIEALQSFGAKYAASSPQRLLHFATGASIKSMAYWAESQILTDPAQKALREQADDRSKMWRKTGLDISEKRLHQLLQENGKSASLGGECSEYPDVVAEEKQVNSLIEKMGLDNKG